MSEIISGMRVIKMYTWEESFAKVVAHIRRYGRTVLVDISELFLHVIFIHSTVMLLVSKSSID